MENLFGQIESRSKSDSIVMRVLRSAMDKSHEKLQSGDGPIEFLHQRSTFYELAAILVEGGLNIVQEEMDNLEDSHDKILSELTGIQQWLQGRIQDMKHLIVEKDREMMERLENESKLRQALELKERELGHMHEKLEPDKANNESFQENSIHNKAIPNGDTEDEISKLKTSVDLQVWNIKQKLEVGEKLLSTEPRKKASRDSSCSPSFAFLDKERIGSLGFTEDTFSVNDSFSETNRIQSDLSRPHQSALSRRMSSDVEILKETLDLAFGKMHSDEVLPLEKQWRCNIEKEIESILVKGFISNIQECFDEELRKKVGPLKDNWFDFINEMKSLCQELKSFCSANEGYEMIQSSTQVDSSSYPTLGRATSEPLLDLSCLEKSPEEDTEVDGSRFVAKMIKNHETFIQKQSKGWDSVAREVLQRKGSPSLIKKDKDHDRLERRMQDAITRLDNLIKRNHKSGDRMGFSDRNNVQDKRRIPKSGIKTNRSSSTVERLEEEIGKLKEERDVLALQISLMEDTYKLLFQGIVKDYSTELHFTDTATRMSNVTDGFSPKNSCNIHRNEENTSNSGISDQENSTSFQILQHYLESSVGEDIYTVFLRETFKEWKKRYVDKKTLQITSDNPKKSISTSTSQSHNVISPAKSSDDFLRNPVLEETIGSLLKEDIYMVFVREMAEAWKSENDASAFENLIREDIHQFVLTEAVKDAYSYSKGSQSLMQLSFQEDTPHSRKLETDGEESLIQKLDSLLKCLEVEEDLMLRATSEIKEHSVNNNLVILNCEEMDERNAIEWLLTDDESTFSSVSEKLERALQQLYTSKELLVEMEQSLEVSDDTQENCHEQSENILRIEHEESRTFLQQKDDKVMQLILSHNILAPITRFQKVVGDFEQMVHENIENKSSRLEVLKNQVDSLIQQGAEIRQKKLLYKNAFISRCHNLKLAESEVDLLGDQVETLLCLLERIYVELNQNAKLLSRYFSVFDILKLIRTELNNEAVCVESL